MDYFRLSKNGTVWDCFDHPDDVGKYVAKILREEPDAKLSVRPITRNQFTNWKQG